MEANRAARVGIALIAVLTLGVPLAPSATANHGNRTLNVTPESAVVPPDSQHVMTATLRSAPTPTSGTVNIDFENQAGVNDIDGVSYATPDLTCSIPAGATSCTVSYTGTNAGRDVWRAWIDHDGVNTTVEADLREGLRARETPGTGGSNCAATATDPSAEPDCTDVVEVFWGTGTLDCDDPRGPDTERQTNPAGGGTVSNEPYTCTVANAAAPRGTTAVVNAEVENGVNDPDAIDGASYDTPDYSCTTSDITVAGGGACRITVTQNENETGTARICFWVGDAAAGAALCADEPTGENQAADGSDAGNDLADAVEKTWELRAPAALDAEPESDRNRLGEQHVVTVTVYDQFDDPFQGNTTVSFEFFKGSPSDRDGDSPATPDQSCTTTNAATCSITYTQSATPGTDLVCAWVNAAPVLKGTNNTGTCDGETSADPDDTPGQADPSVAGDDVDVVQKSWQNPTNAAQLDCGPETSENRTGASHRVTCTARDSAGTAVAGAEIDLEASGVNDPDSGGSFTPPDFSCVTGTDGTCSVLHGPQGVGGKTADAGTTTYRAWIDADNDNATAEADTSEARDEVAGPGLAEPDNTDVVEKTWTAGGCDITGTSRSETLRGTSRGETICGGGGNDLILGAGGNDRIFGGAGFDRLQGGPGDDLLDAGWGNDVLKGYAGNDTLRGDQGNDLLNGGSGRDRCWGGKGADRFRNCRP